MTKNFEIMDQIKGRLLVSCQASPGDPLEQTETIRRIALATVQGGAAGLRLNGCEHIAAVRQGTDLPIIGIEKQSMNGKIRITPDFASAAKLAAAGADIIALDCTNRIWPTGDAWQECIQRIHSELNLPVMADIATLDEAMAAAANGADMIGMTLNGYTEETRGNNSFSWQLLADLVQQSGKPIIAEGHITTPAEARRAIQNGAWSVVVGSAITRPGVITSRFVEAMTPQISKAPAIGVDIGGTFVKAGIVDRAGCVSFVNRLPTGASEGQAAIAAATAQTIENVLAAASKEGIHPVGLGIASAGAIDASRGIVFAATDNLPGWTGFDLRTFAQERFSLPTYFNNDAHAAALAELYFGLGRELSDFVALTIGTGIGGGVVSGGKLIRGQHGFAGTIGHQTIRFDGLACNCGRFGCLEAYVSAAALVREYAVLADIRMEQNRTAISITVEAQAQAVLEISRLASAGDPSALKAYSNLAGYLAEGVANIFNMLDPEMVIISGGLVEGYSQFVSDVGKKTTDLLHFGARRTPRVQLATSTQYAGIQGASASVFEVL